MRRRAGVVFGASVNSSGMLQDEVQFPGGDRRSSTDRRSGEERRAPGDTRTNRRLSASGAQKRRDRRSGHDRRERPAGLLERFKDWLRTRVARPDDDVGGARHGRTPLLACDLR